MRRPLVFLAILGVIALALTLARLHYVRTAEYRTRVAIHDLLLPRNLPAYVKVDDDSTGQRMRRFYRQRGNRPAWLIGDRPTHQARALLGVLRNADREGLPPASYRVGAIEAGFAKRAFGVPLTQPESARLAAIDVLLTHSYLKYARDVYRGRVDPRALPHDWITRPRRLDLVAHLDSALDRRRVEASLEELPPSHPEYQRLKRALARYRQIAAAGGWPIVGRGRTLHLGDRGARVAALRQRLAASGDLSGSAARTAVFDHDLDRAVRRFQASMGLDADGRVGPDEIAALDVPVGDRIRQIELNLERWRWLPQDLGDRYVLVNVPEYMLYVIEHGREQSHMRVIVGDEYTPTAIFSDTLTHLVVNPVWNVPESIALAEIAPELARDPDYLARHRMRAFDAGGRELDPRTAASVAAAAGEETLTIRQDPGEGNALGRLKFMCTNPFNIYLHDTPQVDLFGRMKRDFSHGCIRLERPLEMAEYLMRGQPEWSRARIERAIAQDTTQERHLRLPSRVPIHVLYWTAWTDDQGVTHFRGDVYGIDAMLEQALARRDPAVTTGDRRRGGGA